MNVIRLHIGKSLLLIAFVISAGFCFAQSPAAPVLERKLQLDADNARALDVLKSIESKSGCRFSFNSSLVPETKMVTVHVKNKTVREALDKMFGGALKYKAKGEYIILTKAPAEVKVISGYVENSSGEKVSGASVYDATTMASATTNEYGYYEMKIRRTSPVELSVSKSNYADTAVKLQPASPTLQYIVLEEEQDTMLLYKLRTAKDSILSKINSAGDWTVEQFFKNKNVDNIHDSLNRPFQFSVVPFVGTNGRLSGNVTNDYSFNLFGGYNHSVKKVEFGGLFNIDRSDVSYLQIAGLSNFVGGNVKGVQFAGLNNINLKKTSGAQFAGLANLCLDSVQGSQFAGLINVNLNSTSGAQFAGLTNFNRKGTRGVQFAGLANFSGGESKGVAFAGLTNMHIGNFKGLQYAGLLNFCTGTVHGAQLSGLVNYATRVKGVQLGLFNFADTVSGVSIGLLSFVNKGYHKLELNHDELTYSGIAFRTGVPLFYNIIAIGSNTQIKNDTVDWYFGYGIGSAPRLSRIFSLNFDITAQQMGRGDIVDRLDLLNRFYVGLDIRITKRFSVTAGPVLNGYITEKGSKPAANIDLHHKFYDKPFDSKYALQSWIGWKVAIRFF